jgi:FkbM family methyltransferase
MAKPDTLAIVVKTRAAQGYSVYLSRKLQSYFRRLFGRLVPWRFVRGAANRVVYYPQAKSCQIAELWYLYSIFLGERSDGTFVEVGANDGIFVSNSWGLAEVGWRGMMIEPLPALAEKCRANHALHPRVEVIQTAVGPPGTSSVVLHVAGALTTANSRVFKEYQSIKWARGSLTSVELEVPCVTLDRLLEESGFAPNFDVLIVDVEGFEDGVFAGFEINHWKPKLILVELLDTHPDVRATSRSDALLGAAICEAGYRIVFKDSINTMFARNEVWARAFGVSDIN